MFKTKKDVDRHVRTALSKLHSENEKNLRGFTIAKLYFKIHEYATAQHYVSSYLTVNETYAPAHKLLGQCLVQLKKPDKALEAFQRSLNLDPKQPDLLVEVCKMLLSEENATSTNKAKYWCDLAESENVQHNAVFSLRLKLLNKSSLESTHIEELILKEISSRPTDPNLRVRIVKHFIEQNKTVEAFKYVYDLEMNSHSLFANCMDWYNVVWIVLNKFRQLPSSKKSWDYWLLSMICIERQVELSFTNSNNNLLANGGTTDIANLLFTFDQHLFECAKYVVDLSPEKELGTQFLYYFCGQLCLHAAALIYRREQVLNKSQWREATKNALPILLFAFHCGAPDLKESWLKHCGERTRQLIQTWHREAAFRCAQAGRTIISCIDHSSNDSLISQVNSLTSDQNVWSSAEDVISQIRQSCSDTAWRAKTFRILFPNSDQLLKIQSSHLVNCEQLAEPTYELPKRSELEIYEEVAQYLRPQSLSHMVYLCIGMENLSDVRCKYFNGLNFSTQNLAFCGAESLTRLDIESFLCASVIQAKRSLEVEHTQYESYNAKNAGKPKILPYANMFSNLCNESQSNWWNAAYQVYKNLAGDNLAELRAILQYGIEAVRGINGPKMDLIIILSLGKIFASRAQDATKSIERGFLENRFLTLYKYGLTMLKLHNKGVLEPFRKLFKYTNANSVSVERHVNMLAEEAVTAIATRLFKVGEYEECIEELSGIQLPYATYFQAEAYRKLDESNKTPKKTKRFYSDKARDCLDQTLQLLSFSNDKNHPLKSIVQSEMKRSQYAELLVDSEHLNDIDRREEYLNESFNTSRTHRELHSSLSNAKTVELENLIKQMMNTLAFVKEELVDRIRPEVSAIKTDISILKDKVATIEESMKKRSEPPSRDDATKVFDDLYIIGDDLQPVMLSQYSNQPQTQATQQRMQTPNALLNQPPPSMLHNSSMQPGPNIYNSPLYNPISGNLSNPLLNQQAHHAQYNNPGAATNVYNTPHYNPNYPFNYYSQIVMPPSIMNVGLPSQQQQPLLPQNESNPSLYDILNLPTSAPNINQGLEKLTVDKSSTQASNITVGGMWNRLYNNTLVEKGPPVNVVITNSEPLPAPTMVSAPSTLSVTIPPQHIKPTLVPVPNDVEGVAQSQTNTSFPMITPNPTLGNSTALSAFGVSTITSTPSSLAGVSFALPKPSFADQFALNKSNESTDNDLNRSTDTEYEPQVNFQPVIPLPAEVEIKTGEENEDILFCSRAKLLRLIEKEWKERGIGEIKILKSKTDGKIRILMRRDQTHKTCANHYITPEIKLIQARGDGKSFIWCADDFADEVVKREQFCVRFKEEEIGNRFQKAFHQAQEELKAKDSVTATVSVEKSELENKKEAEKSSIIGFNVTKAPIFNFANTNTSTPKGDAKATAEPKINASKTGRNDVPSNNFGKLAFSSEPLPTETKTTEVTKPSPFANFSFSSTPTTTTSEAASPFANIFSKTTQKTVSDKATFLQPMNLAASPKSGSGTKDAANKLNTSDADVEDEYVPTAQFKPVIPLPDLVEVQTGEENEDVRFEHRAKLLRFDKSTGEWKERGIGIMKILVDRNDKNKVRLVMRREQIFKLCCNQRITKDTSFKYAHNSTNALTWVGQDYSDNELQAEILTVRFKTSETCKDFYNAILTAQAEMTEVENGKPEKTNVPNRGVKDTQITDSVKGKDSVNKNAMTTPSESGFGDKFKPKPGAWSCSACYVSNIGDALYCVACEQPKDDSIPKKPIAGTFNVSAPIKTAFTFGFGANNANKSTDVQKTTVEGFGDKFKPKVGSWSCQSCYVLNEAEKLYCGACESPKDDSVPKKDPIANIFAPGTNTPKFQFGFTSATSDLQQQESSFATSAVVPAKSSLPPIAAPTTVQNNSNPFDFANKSGFIFGTAPNSSVSNVFSVDSNVNPSFTFSSSAIFGVTNENSQNKAESVKPTLDLRQKPSTNGDDKLGNEFSLGKQQFQFTLQPKSPGKIKTPTKNTSGFADDESDGENIEEENNTYFTPVIPLPEKVDVVTGEENEESLYCHRAKLFRFISGEWKERGVGDVKILRHRITGKLRIVMRREKVHKICLNHVLTPEIEYQKKDDKSWHFAVNDFSEGEFQSTIFSIRFKTKEIADDFMEAVKKALHEGSSDGIESKDSESIENVLIPEELKKLAERLQLPYSFYQHDDSSQCPGCRGCDPDAFTFPQTTDTNELVDSSSPIPLIIPQTQTRSKSILKKSVLTSESAAQQSDNNSVKKNLFSVNLFSSNDTEKNVQPSETTNPVENKFVFSLGDAKATSGQESGEGNFTSGGFLFGTSKTTFGSLDKAKPVFGQNIFGNANASSEPSTSSVFGNASIIATTTAIANLSTTQSTISNIFESEPKVISHTTTTIKTTTSTESSNNFSENSKDDDANGVKFQPIFETKSGFTFDSSGFTSTFGTLGSLSARNIFGGNIFGATTKKEGENTSENLFQVTNSQPSTNFAESESKKDVGSDLYQPIFKNDPGLSFAFLAANANSDTGFQATMNNQTTDGFFGLNQTGNFRTFLNSSKDKANASNDGASSVDDSAYDPHYDPIIELPELITITTGEENEEKLFGERGILYLYDVTTKEWKERGTGEMKILHHREKGTYRLLLRREQIHKLVLNHAIAADFQLKPMNTSGKSFCWGAMNYAENPPTLERLAVRFKNTDIASRFENQVLKCIENAKQRAADLEPEED